MSRRSFIKGAALTSLAATLSACISDKIVPTPTIVPEEIALPTPRTEGPMSLEETLAKRRSVRQFTTQSLTWDELSQLLWATQGVTDPRGFRTAPSAGALYPLEVYLATPEAAYRYIPQGHRVVLQIQGDHRIALWHAGLQQEALREAPVIFVLAAVYGRTERKYGGRAARYVQLEAGHAAQNLLLQAVALGLGAVPIGAFADEEIQIALALPADHKPLYLIPVGYPRV
ncbi:MAG: nitroreductase family protein [Chloroflexi bacterium]|nr:nitroreductase family protein [Chloroflexota bacterium]